MLTDEEKKAIIKETVREEILKMEIKEFLPQKKLKAEMKATEFLDIIAKPIQIGIELYGAYHFGNFLGKVAAKIKHK